MPDLTGIDVIQRSRNAGIRTDFIILSGYDDFSYARDAMRYGAKAYLLKPLNGSELNDEICRIFLERTSQNRGTTRRLYQDQFNLNFFNNLIDGKILEPAIISRMLCDTNLPLSDSSCYVCVFMFEESLPGAGTSFSPEPVIEQLNQEFSDEKHIFWKHDPKQLVGIFQYLQPDSLSYCPSLSGHSKELPASSPPHRRRGYGIRPYGVLLLL